jgi:hypothetical protein
MGLFSVNKSSSTTQLATTNNYDQRQVNDASGGGVIGSGNAVNSGNTWLDLTQLTTSNTQNTQTNTSNAYTDSSSRTTSDSGNTSASWTDNSNRAVTSNSYGTDPGVQHIADTNAALLATLGQQQGDSMKVIAGLGATGIKQMGESATNLFGQAEQNSAQVWTHTLDASQEALKNMFSAASSTLSAGTQLAQGAMATYQPADSKASDNQTKVAILGVIAIIVAAFIQSRKG